MDSITAHEMQGFLISATLGWLAYLLATVSARFISRVPRHVYIGRLVFMGFFTVLILVLYAPLAAEAFSGSAARYYEIGGEARGMGAFCGIQTIWIWCTLALLKWPKTHHDQAA